MKCVIRWLGAFRNQHVTEKVKDFRKALEFEFDSKWHKQKAGELCTYHKVGVRSPIGLVFAPEDMVRYFPGDIYSKIRKNGCLKRGEERHHSDHNEVWVHRKAVPVAIVFKRRYCRNSISTEAKNFGRERGIPVIEWGQLPKFLNR